MDSKKLYRGKVRQKIEFVVQTRSFLSPQYDAIFLLHRAKAYNALLAGKGPIYAMDREHTRTLGPLHAIHCPPLVEHEGAQIARIVETGLQATLGHSPSFDHNQARQMALTWLPQKPNLPPFGEIGLHLGGGQNQGNEFQLKQWPHWEDLVMQILEQTPHSVRFLGGPTDKDFADSLYQKLPEELQPRVRNSTGRLSLTELAETLSSCRAFVGVDSGPLHMADYYGIPSVGLFGPTSPISWGLLRPGSFTLFEEVDCRPCYKDDGEFPECPHSRKCMKKLGAHRVFSRLLDVLKTPS